MSKRRTGKYIRRLPAFVGLMLAFLLSICGFPALQGCTVISDGESLSERNYAIPVYSGEPYAEVNHNEPFFTDEERKNTVCFENYSDLDSLGRCGVAFANIGTETLPTEKRGKIGHIKPTGWMQHKYEGVVDSDPPYLYNRCHLIAFCLAGENDNEKNLITGTNYMNATGMLPFEEQTVRYVEKTGNHVLYRVTPVFEGDDLLAKGVLMEAYSVEDCGKGICFCVYVFNVQPGIEIDYKTGENRLEP